MMTTRRGRSSGSSLPGSGVWRGSIQSIKRELRDDNGRLMRVLEEQETEKAEEVQPLFDLAQSLGVEELLSYMNDTLLDGEGVVKTILRWEEGADFTEDDEEDEDWDEDEDEDWDDEDDDEDEDWDDEDEELEEEEGRPYLFVVLSVILTWKHGGRLQLKVDLQHEDDGFEVRVNGWPVDGPSARDLQSVLVKVFREHMDENYGKFEEEA